MRFLLTLVCVALLGLGGHPVAADDAGPTVTPVQNKGDYVRPKPKKGFRYPDCFCTDSTGKRVELGMTSCLKIGSQRFLARCGMSLNNPAWRRVDDKCPSPST